MTFLPDAYESGHQQPKGCRPDCNATIFATHPEHAASDDRGWWRNFAGWYSFLLHPPVNVFLNEWASCFRMVSELGIEENVFQENRI